MYKGNLARPGGIGWLAFSRMICDFKFRFPMVAGWYPSPPQRPAIVGSRKSLLAWRWAGQYPSPPMFSSAKRVSSIQLWWLDGCICPPADGKHIPPPALIVSRLD